MEEDMFSSFSQIEIETKEKSIKTTILQLNKIPESRKDVTFEYLRGLEKDLTPLEARIGKFTPVPIFGDEESPYVPKDFNPKENFFLSEQRFQILKEVIEKSSAGLLFVGPHGVGKSSLTYFVACYAWVNAFPLIYIPRCSMWCGKLQYGEDSCALFWLKQFYHFNNDLLKEYKFLEDFESSLQKLEKGKWRNEEGCSKLQGQIMEAISNQNETKVFYILDEHQLLFEPIDRRTSTLRFVDIPYFRAYKEWTSATSGVKTITIYSGSANSKFQFHLPSGEERKIRFIIPPTEREFKTIISDEHSTLKFPRRDEVNKLEIATGRNFREMSHYIQVCKSNYDKYMIAAKENMTTRLRSFKSQATEDELKQFMENLDGLFGLRFYNKEPSFPGAFYDRGLIYKEEHGGHIKFLNLPAKEVLLRDYLNHFKMQKIGDWDGADLQGKFLEKYCVNSDLSSDISIELHRSGGTKVLMRYEVSRFDYLEDLQVGDGKKYFKTTLLLTKNRLFPYIDYVIYIPESQRVIFKQISMSTIANHLKKPKNEFERFEKTYPELNESVGEVLKFLCHDGFTWNDGVRQISQKEGKGEGKSVCHLILELLFGKIEKYQVVVKDGIFHVFLGEKELDLEIIYVTGTKLEENKEVKELPLKNLVCCFREDLERLKIPF